MAVIVRRTWAQIETEVKLRIGNPNNTTILTQQFIWAAYLRLALTWHHFELDAIASPNLTLSTSTNLVALPADCFAVVQAMLLNSAGTVILGQLEPVNYASLVREYAAAAGQPAKRARYGSNLYFDALPNSAFKVQLSYYRRPTAPDFSSGGSELDVECDEHIIEQAVALAAGATGAPGVALNRQLLTEWLAEQVRNPMIDSVEDLRERVNTNRTLGGAQG